MGPITGIAQGHDFRVWFARALGVAAPDHLGAVRCPECGHANLTVPDLSGRHLDGIMHKSLKRERTISRVLFAVAAACVILLMPVLGLIGTLVFGGIMLIVWFIVRVFIDIGEGW